MNTKGEHIRASNVAEIESGPSSCAKNVRGNRSPRVINPPTPPLSSLIPPPALPQQGTHASAIFAVRGAVLVDSSPWVNTAKGAVEASTPPPPTAPSNPIAGSPAGIVAAVPPSPPPPPFKTPPGAAPVATAANRRLPPGGGAPCRRSCCTLCPPEPPSPPPAGPPGVSKKSTSRKSPSGVFHLSLR